MEKMFQYFKLRKNVYTQPSRFCLKLSNIQSTFWQLQCFRNFILYLQYYVVGTAHLCMLYKLV